MDIVPNELQKACIHVGNIKIVTWMKPDKIRQMDSRKPIFMFGILQN